MKLTLLCTLLLGSSVTYATATYYPGNTGGPTAGDLKALGPVYYPPTNPLPNVDHHLVLPSVPSFSQNTNPQLHQQRLPPSTGQ